MTTQFKSYGFFQDLKKLLKSSASNYMHNRSDIGQKKLIESHRRISDFLGDSLPLSKSEIFIRHIQAHLEPDQFVICKICGKSVNQIYKEKKP